MRIRRIEAGVLHLGLTAFIISVTPDKRGFGYLHKKKNIPGR